VFAPLNVNAPLPAFVSVKAPLSAPPRTTPLAAAVNVAFAVNVPFPTSANVPLFVTSPNVTAPPNEYPFVKVRAVVESLESAPAVIVSNPVPNAALLPTRTVPELTVTPPENVFAPLNVKVPVPFFTNEPPAPPINPA
jgi:hypothetical protein